MSVNPYPTETLHEDDDDGTMPDSRDALAEAVVGHRIVAVEKHGCDLAITLSSGKRVWAYATSNCCAFTEVETFLLNADRIDHIITGVGTTDGFTKWHVFADMGDVLELTVGWSPGNPFYYGYGFQIAVEDA